MTMMLSASSNSRVTVQRNSTEVYISDSSGELHGVLIMGYRKVSKSIKHFQGVHIDYIDAIIHTVLQIGFSSTVYTVMESRGSVQVTVTILNDISLNIPVSVHLQPSSCTAIGI